METAIQTSFHRYHINDTHQVLTPPSKTLKYYDCYGGFQCARLQTNTTVAVAIIKLPATVSEDDATFGGSVLISPGGPGYSGTDLLLRSGSRFQSLLAGERNYEIIGFDPRGVNLSTPHGDCYKGDEISRKLDQERNTGLSPITEDFNALNYHYASALGKSELCEVDGVDSIWGYLNTASVARDVIEIIDRIDDLRWQNRNSTKPANAPKTRLQYIGISYGSFLGNTLASMFPERVGRIMVDGIVNAEDYTNVTWQKNLNDSEAVLDYFYQVCFDSGEGCPIRLSSDKEAADIKSRVEAFLNTLDIRPIPVAHGGKPLSPANTLRSLRCCRRTPLIPHVAYGVVCSDAVDGVAYRNLSVSDELVHIIDRQAPTTGVVWGGRVIACAGRKIRPPFAFTGPFGSPAVNVSDPNTPETPLLIISSRFDPATPVANAFTLQKQHVGSGVVIQESTGHGVTGAGINSCTANTIREFFLSGKVPLNLTICQAECIPTIPAERSNCSAPLW
ncbi:hypothetical protein K456DRAFT_1748894 [Colletotrichum gloeosporioides 23]|nr:hypothetical protein K456DRAFT_1748894 [Colletotrichum gloeosporioides 23]